MRIVPPCWLRTAVVEEGFDRRVAARFGFFGGSGHMGSQLRHIAGMLQKFSKSEPLVT